jgi:hypothetical protein
MTPIWLKKIFERIKLKNIAIAAVLVTQTIKRIAQSEIGLLVLDMAPIPWVNFIGKVLGWIAKTNEILPEIVRGIVLKEGILSEWEATDHKYVMQSLIDHLSNFSKDDLDNFLAFMALQIMNARAGDGVVDEWEKKEIMEESYKYLFKNQSL